MAPYFGTFPGASPHTNLNSSGKRMPRRSQLILKAWRLLRLLSCRQHMYALALMGTSPVAPKRQPLRNWIRISKREDNSMFPGLSAVRKR